MREEVVMNRRRNGVGAILLLAVLPLVAACGSGGSASGESSAAPASSAPETTSGEVVELQFLAQNNSPEAWAVLEGVVEGFNTEFAGKINVKVTGVDGLAVGPRRWSNLDSLPR
jgi:ABC-type glycerol-3-phosphate transport system substrate-binding protein